jgi:hypothetical protein
MEVLPPLQIMFALKRSNEVFDTVDDAFNIGANIMANWGERGLVALFTDEAERRYSDVQASASPATEVEWHDPTLLCIFILGEASASAATTEADGNLRYWQHGLLVERLGLTKDGFDVGFLLYGFGKLTHDLLNLDSPSRFGRGRGSCLGLQLDLRFGLLHRILLLRQLPH